MDMLTLLTTVEFVHPWRLLLCPVAIVFLCLAWFFRHRALARIREDPFFAIHLEHARIPRMRSDVFRFTLKNIAVAALVAAVAVPEATKEVREPEYGGVRVTWILDTSRSVFFAHDVPGFLHRFAAIRSLVHLGEDMLSGSSGLSGMYQRSVIAFAGTAQKYLGFTSSGDTVGEVLEQLDGNIAFANGTDVLGALELYQKEIEKHPPKKGTIDIAVFLSDGGKEDVAGIDRSRLWPLVERVNALATVIVVGVGSTTPVDLSRVGPSGDHIAFLRKKIDEEDKEGEVWQSALDEDLMREIAGRKDHYVHASDRAAFLALLRTIVLERRQIVGERMREERIPIAEWFLACALLSLILVHVLGFLDRRAAMRQVIPHPGIRVPWSS